MLNISTCGFTPHDVTKLLYIVMSLCVQIVWIIGNRRAFLQRQITKVLITKNFSGKNVL